MSLLTPTSSSGLIAGFALWLVGWATFLHLDSVPFIGKFINKEAALHWILTHKTLTLLASELVNFTVHSPSNPNSTLFALGGTLFNTIMIFVFLPFRQWRNRKTSKEILRGMI
jgi:hypothetical protein